MLTIIHGSDTAASRKFFILEKDKISGVEILKETQVNITDLSQILQGGGLFENNRSIFIEGLLTERKKGSEKDAIISYLSNQAKTHAIFLWEGKELTPSALSQFKQASVKSFKLSSSLFTLLDSIKPRNGALLVQLFHKSLETNDAEMIFFMLIRQFRILLALSEKALPADKQGTETISEINRLAPWQKTKLDQQTKLFEKDSLRQLYSKLFRIELAQKTGALPSSLTSALDFFLAYI